MKFGTILLLSLMVHTSWASAQTRQSVAGSTAAPSTEEEIEKLEEMRNQAVLHSDVAALDRMTSDDYIFLTLIGEMRTKAEILVCVWIVPL